MTGTWTGRQHRKLPRRTDLDFAKSAPLDGARIKHTYCIRMRGAACECCEEKKEWCPWPDHLRSKVQWLLVRAPAASHRQHFILISCTMPPRCPFSNLPLMLTERMRETTRSWLPPHPKSCGKGRSIRGGYHERAIVQET